MESSTISSLARLHLQSSSRLLASACCPDKDLVVLISRPGNAVRMSLWKMQGSKKWEIDVNEGSSGSEEITALSWSPDGQTIVVAHYPPRISLHSIQSGREERSLYIGLSSSSSVFPSRITGLYWFKNEQKNTSNSLQDLFNRGHIITGSAHSVLRMQPLLDPLEDDSQIVTATDLFAFQGSQARAVPKAAALSEVIASWPALPPDLLAASIKASSRLEDNRPGEELDEVDKSNMNSLLVAIDNTGQMYFFWDGYYSLGAVSLGSHQAVTSLIKDCTDTHFFAHAQNTGSDGSVSTNLLPMAIILPLLDLKTARQVAESCSTARELVYYTMRVVRDMRKAWFGDDGQVGAREINAHWIRGLHEKQAQFGHKETNAVLDLTCMLTTGRASDALVDFLSSGEQTSERGLQKWEATITEALMKLREHSEKRVAPACQRLHLVLEEVKGWSLLSQQYAQYEFDTAEVEACLDLTGRGIVIAAWLAATARRELLRFREFISFLRYETSRGHVNNPDIHTVLPRHDILEVNSYLESGLVVSSIDKWFIGPVPQFTPHNLTATPSTESLSAVIERARRVAKDGTQVTWPPNTEIIDLSHLDRNLDALIQALAERCQRVFNRAAKAVVRTARQDSRGYTPSAPSHRASFPEPTAGLSLSESVLVRERTCCDKNESGKLLQYLAIRVVDDGEGRVDCRELLCIIRGSFVKKGELEALCKVDVAILQCGIRNEQGSAWFNVPGEDFLDELHILDGDFFDEQHLVIVYSVEGAEGPANIAMVDYSALGYHEVDVSRYVKGPTREDIVSETIEKRRAGQLASVPIPIKKRRPLVIGKGEGVSVSVNGRVGRRVACVLDGAGLEMEMLDMEGDEEGEE